jgi:hypothetical protein
MTAPSDERVPVPTCFGTGDELCKTNGTPTNGVAKPVATPNATNQTRCARQRKVMQAQATSMSRTARDHCVVFVFKDSAKSAIFSGFTREFAIGACPASAGNRTNTRTRVRPICACIVSRPCLRAHAPTPECRQAASPCRCGSPLGHLGTPTLSRLGRRKAQIWCFGRLHRQMHDS